MSVKAHSDVGRGRGKGNIAAALVSLCTEHQFLVMCKNATFEDIKECTLHIFMRSEKLIKYVYKCKKVRWKQGRVNGTSFLGGPQGSL